VLAEQSSSDDRIPSEPGKIEVRISDLAQLFNSMDPSPFHEKDLDRNAEEYIVDAARRLKHEPDVTLRVYLDKPVGLPDEQRVLGNAIRVHFARRSQLARRRLRELLRRGWMNLIIGLSLLTASVIVGESMARRSGNGPFATVLRESLLIGGWVAMSRPMEILLYDWWAVRSEQRAFDRLSRIKVLLTYTTPRKQNSHALLDSHS
jgi:hypothetical protein